MRDFARLLILGTAALASCGDDTPDPDRAVRDGGIFVEGWQARFDSPKATLEDVRFTRSDSGDYEVKVGPNVVLWDGAAKASGTYSLSVEVEHENSHGHHHGAGLLFGGRDLDGDGQVYSYFLVHGGGKFLIKRRDGVETKPIVAYTAHEAVERGEAGARNRLRVDVGAEQTKFFINDVEVHAAPNAELHTEGFYGFRLVHNLDVTFRGFELETP